MPDWARAIIAFSGGVLLLLLGISAFVITTTQDPGLRQMWAGALYLVVGVGLAVLVIVLVVQVPIVGITDRQRRVIIFLGTPAAGIAVIAFLANIAVITIPFWGMVLFLVFVYLVAITALSFVGWLGLRP